MIQPLRLEIPSEIATERLLLRTPRTGDGAVIIDAVLASLAELKLWMPWATDSYNLGDAEDWCRRSAARFITRDDLVYLIFHRETSRHIGTLSTWSKGWDVPRFEIGYWLSTSETRHGYMTEAVQALTEMTFNTCRARRIEIRTDAKNSRSRRVAERCGYLLEGILRNECREQNGELRDTAIYGLTR
jgi:RimJ/RimL family protein N-acetyltransferase